MASLLRVSVSHRAHMRFELAAELPAVEGDAAQLRQVVMNLITNASDAVDSGGGEVILRTGLAWVGEEDLRRTIAAEEARPGYHVVLEVADTGPGMDTETRARIFDPFFTTKFTGRGLGLAAVLGIVRGHRGAICVDTAPGAGTTFRIHLPVTKDAAEASLCRSAALDPAWQGAGTVLVVDDEPQVRTLARRMLERHGFQVHTATDGREALEVAATRAGELVLVLLDLTMPGMDGYSVLRELHAVHPSLPVILCSGYSEEELRRGSGGLAAGFLHKPFRLEELLGRVQGVLRERRAPEPGSA